MKKPSLIAAFIVILTVISLPYALAYLAGGQGYQFAGFLLNPLDGASYLAKMQEGWAGSWRFTLPFTAEPGQGAYLFLYYLFLGHLARWLHLPLLVVYHAARVLGALALLGALARLYELIFPDRPDLFRLAFWLTVVGSGLGWLLIFTGMNPPPTDFWVAEAYPFLSMFSNPHFPLGLALLLVSFICLLEESIPWRNGILLAVGLLLSIIFPFAEVCALLTAGVWAVWTWIETKRLPWLPVVSLGLLGGPFLLYQFWVAQTDPILAGWNAQNFTPSPPVWDFIAAFSPALLLALFGGYALLKRPRRPAIRLLLAWAIPGLLLIYFPFALQRRFMLGFYIPAAALAVFGIEDLRCRFPRWTKRLAGISLGLSLPTNVFLVLLLFVGIYSNASDLFLTRSEVNALNWVSANTTSKALVAAPPDLAKMIPGWTGRRVVYGHPYETVNADAERSALEAFYQGQSGTEYLSQRQVDYVIVDSLDGGKTYPDLAALGMPLVYQSGPVVIYDVRGIR